ncbi:multisubunit sodium/proton antiporter, MrpG subunit [Halopseudomonas xinjiangensis]|uniref:Multisubunit sodium/proton antiporter, MrpG subunit n=1 Tax=Halopseudomonas xinjiangensis TaxID=487184 RepID=A0A1H1YWA6_9GAMM|nr:monovalent cation/H(+) antiporter subunit G [Halopseudomonas xinjiangensis]SDT25698.1 multisubunit sodium/proton antiporter, MrpG subunit [Halopseudomonas xinjiangensis]
MSEWLAVLSVPFWVAGGFFFIAGTVGLLRFPDLYCRLHAVTKADTLGLGCVVVGLALRADGPREVLVMLLIWLLIMGSGATACQLLAHYRQEASGSTIKDSATHAAESSDV